MSKKLKELLNREGKLTDQETKYLKDFYRKYGERWYSGKMSLKHRAEYIKMHPQKNSLALSWQAHQLIPGGTQCISKKDEMFLPHPKWFKDEIEEIKEKEFKKRVPHNLQVVLNIQKMCGMDSFSWMEE